MSYTHLSLDPFEGDSGKIQAGILDSIKTEDLERSRHAGALGEKLDLLGAEYKEMLRQIVGPAAFDAVQRLREERNGKWSAAMKESGAGPSAQKKHDEIRGEFRASFDAFAEKQKWNAEKIRAQQKLFNQKAETLFAEPWGKDVLIDNKEKIENQDYYPRFSGAYSHDYAYVSSSAGRTTFSNTPFADAGSGEFGAEMHATLYVTSDSDWGFTFRDSSILQWHRLGGRGTLQVQPDVLTVDVRNWGTIWDEYGWSNISVFQQCRPYVQRIYPSSSPLIFPPSLPAFSQYDGGGFAFNDTNNRDHNWGFRQYPAGNHQTFHVVTPGTLEADTWALVKVGVQIINSVWTNDTSVDSNLMGRYRLARLGLWHR